MIRHVLIGVLLPAMQMLACAQGHAGPNDEAPHLPLDFGSGHGGPADEPPGADAVAAYIADVLTPGGHTRRTPTGYAMLDAGSRVIHTVDVALTSHQCWKIKDGYQCRSTVRTTMTPASGRPRTTRVEISNDYQWRGGRLFSARLEAMRQQTLALAKPEDASQAQPEHQPGGAPAVAAAAVQPERARP